MEMANRLYNNISPEGRGISDSADRCAGLVQWTMFPLDSKGKYN